MPHYNREILVPYLKDVCSAELLCRKLEQQKNVSESKLRDANYYLGNKPQVPAMPIRENYTENVVSARVNVVVGILFVAFFAFLVPIIYKVGYKLDYYFDFGFFGSLLCEGITWLLIIGAGLFSLCGLVLLPEAIGDRITAKRKDKKAYECAMERYQAAKARYDKWCANLSYYQNVAQRERTNLTACKTHLAEAQQLRTQLYNVNVIPSKYRNAYAAYYLYDYFNTSREDDLTQVLQTMLLEEIIKRLDKIIERQEDIIIGQQRTMAMMEQQNKAAEQHRRGMMNHIAQIEQNQAQQTDYLQMIEAHERTTSFFAYATYLDEIKK